MIASAERVVEATAVPQLLGRERPHGSVLYTCGGTNEYGKPCGKLLFVWVPVAPIPGDYSAMHGTVEIKCRRCKALNAVALEKI
jgi:hypothetical protein